MNKPILKFILFVFVLLPFLSFSQVKIDLDRPKALFNINETMYFRLSSPSGGEGTFEMYYDPRNPTAAFKKGTLKLKPGRDTFIFHNQTQPGVVFFRATVNGVSSVQATAFNPLSIEPSEKEPTDFDAFWDKQKADLARVPMIPTLTQINTLPNGSKLYMIEMNQVDGRKVYGYLSVPAGSGKFPAILNMPPYGNAPFQADELVTTDFSERGRAISLSITVHNTPPNISDPLAYFPDDITQADKMYNRWMVLAGIRAIDYLTSRFDFNGSLGITGLSQGGGLALMVAGLDSRVSAVIASHPAHCDHAAFRTQKASGFPQYLLRGVNTNLDTQLVSRAVRYHDATYFIKRYKKPLLLLVGYTDDVSPASSVFAAFNQHQGESTILHMLNTGHNYPWNEYWLGRYAFFKQHLVGFNNPFSFNKGFSINAGADQLNVNDFKVTLKGDTKVDGSNGQPITVRWSQVSGPGKASFFTPNEKTTIATFSKPGTYMIRFSADYEYLLNQKPESKYYTMKDYVIVQVQRATNQNEIKKNNPIRLFPNPATDRAVIQWDTPSNFLSYTLLSINGAVIERQKLPPLSKEAQIDLSRLNNGLYFIEMTTAKGETFAEKIVVER